MACKVFESVIKSKLLTFFKANNFLSLAQHGFLQGHSTCTNILECVNDWTLNINNGNYTRVAYIDFAKAFDTVCLSKLLYKLKCAGVDGLLLRVIESFLRNRSQSVVTEGVKSEPVNVISGVPQGSVLGLFFSLSI